MVRTSYFLVMLFSYQTCIFASTPDYSPPPQEQQLPKAMHSAMEELPRITVGMKNADITGSDNRALQAAVDYIAGLGGGWWKFSPVNMKCTIRCIYARM